MLKEQFEIAANQTRIRTPNLIEAARAVLVDKESAAEVAARLGIAEVSHIYKATQSIQRKWSEICSSQNWSYRPIALPERMMRIVLEIQAQELEDYQREHQSKTVNNEQGN